MREPPLLTRLSTRDITAGAVRDVAHTPGLLRLIVYSIGVFVLVRCATMSFFNPALAALGVPVDRYGSVLAATNVFAALAAWQTHRGLARPGERALLVGMPVALVLMYCGLALASQPVAALLFCVQGAVFGAYPVAVRSLLNRLVPTPERRATVLSVESMAVRIAGGVAVIFCGWAIDHLALDNALLITAAAGCVPFLCVPFLRRAVTTGRV
jgi:predicted MFS family arabinose efflux permease